MEWVEFSCNICDMVNRKRRPEVGRESPSCDGCGSTVRMRAVAFLVVKHLQGTGGPLRTLGQSQHVGVGLSDWAGYAKPLERLLRYQNTYYTREPRLDITNPPPHLEGHADFVIASDVFEHVMPPVDKAFSGAFRLLRPGGAMIFSVPYGLVGDTIEHFPNLHDFSIQGEGADVHLVNRTAQGTLETFRGLCFHGGEGATLEMRVFSLPSLEAHCQAAGFESPEIMLDVPEHGILWPHGWSRAMLLRRPRNPNS